MNLKNDYKVLYAEAADGIRTFKASKTGAFADAEVIAEFEIGKYKLIYENNGKIYCSETGVPSDADECIDAFDKLFSVEDVEDNTAEEKQEEATEEDLEADKNEQIVEGVTGDPATEEELPE